MKISKLRRNLAVFLSALMVTFSLPMTVSAEEINAVTVNVDISKLPTTLTAGQTPDTETIKQAFSVPSNANYEINWCLISNEDFE